MDDRGLNNWLVSERGSQSRNSFAKNEKEIILIFLSEFDFTVNLKHLFEKKNRRWNKARFPDRSALFLYKMLLGNELITPEQFSNYRTIEFWEENGLQCHDRPNRPTETLPS
jgi:hypothetical protein